MNAHRDQFTSATTIGKHLVTFNHHGDPGSEVFVAGEFNNWNPLSHPLKDQLGCGNYQRRMFLPTGTYPYKLVVDGEWTIDCNCARWQPNEFGSLNSLAIAK